LNRRGAENAKKYKEKIKKCILNSLSPLRPLRPLRLCGSNAFISWR
jgi:hypothetical protein